MNAVEEGFNFCVGKISEIEKQDNIDGIFDTLRLFTETIGGTSLLIGQMQNPIIEGKNVRQLGRTDWPEEYFNMWADHLMMFSDPIAHFSKLLRRPLEWSEAYVLSGKAGKKVLNLGREYNLTNGIAVTIANGFGPLGVVSMGYEHERPSENDILLLELISIHAYQHLLSINNADKLNVTAALTPREKEIMHYVAAGKTNWEVATVLSVSEKTIAQHMTNINRKLKSTNRAQAVIMGVKSGQVFL